MEYVATPSDVPAGQRSCRLLAEMLTGLVALIFAVGIYAAIAVFLALFLKLVSKLSLAAAAGIAIAAAALVWFLLAFLLKMDVYSGYLGARLG